MAKTDPQPDVLVLGEHPAAYLCAALLRHKTKLRVIQATLPNESWPDRLVLINPDLFSLHPILESLKRKLDLKTIYGVRFLADSSETSSEYRSKTAMAYVGSYKAIRAAMMKVAEAEDVSLVVPKTFDIHSVDDRGVEVTLGKSRMHPKALVLAGLPTPAQQKILGLPDNWGPEVVHRYTFLKLPVGKWGAPEARPVVPMALNLNDTLCWGWLLPGEKCWQLAVEQPIETLNRIKPEDLLHRWAQTLIAHGMLPGGPELPIDQAETLDLPLTGALAHEGVGSRTLLIGPAGGFYSATAEDIYPNCWSAVFAASAIKAALREVHLQDALQPYRQKWRTTLGDYLRGPQQNLKFLLPLVYRNQVMTSRLAEAIMLGKQVVR